MDKREITVEEYEKMTFLQKADARIQIEFLERIKITTWEEVFQAVKDGRAKMFIKEDKE